MFVLRFLIKWFNVKHTKNYINECLTLSLICLINFAVNAFSVLKLGITPTLFFLLVGNLLFYVYFYLNIRYHIKKIQLAVKKGLFSDDDFNCLLAFLAAAPFLIAPGALSFFIILLITGLFRKIFGRHLSKVFSIDWKDVYEYLNLESV